MTTYIPNLDPRVHFVMAISSLNPLTGYRQIKELSKLYYVMISKLNESWLQVIWITFSFLKVLFIHTAYDIVRKEVLVFIRSKGQVLSLLVL